MEAKIYAHRTQIAYTGETFRDTTTEKGWLADGTYIAFTYNLEPYKNNQMRNKSFTWTVDLRGLGTFILINNFIDSGNNIPIRNTWGYRYQEPFVNPVTTTYTPTSADGAEIILDKNFGLHFTISDYSAYELADIYTTNSDYIPYITLDYNPIIPPAPDTLTPNNVNRNAKGQIDLSWRYIQGNNEFDKQKSSTIRYRVIGGDWVEIPINNILNTYTLLENTFINGQIVEWQARVETVINGYSNWSNVATFILAPTPPLASILIFPLNIAINASNGVPLEWRYNSPYDTIPSRFDARYRIDNGDWIIKSNTGQLSIMTDSITTQSTVEWQVKAFGQLGDEGPWSNIGVFFTVGSPPTPIITQITNSNRPTITFSASKEFLSWELQILQGNKIIYNTGNLAFIGDFTHQTNVLISNGNYLARIRIKNEFGLISDWGQLAFSINTITPKPLKLEIANNLRFFNRLYFNNINNKTIYIYRDNIRIAMTKNSNFDDYTCNSQKRHLYFIRIVESNFAFADSNIVVNNLTFIETTIAEYEKPYEMLKLIFAMESKPTKNINYGVEKSLTQFIGRKSPVLEIGEHETKTLALAFYINFEEYEKLEELNRSQTILILRDWRLGVVYGTIDGNITANNETDGFNVSFNFTQVDFNIEVDL